MGMAIPHKQERAKPPSDAVLRAFLWVRRPNGCNTPANQIAHTGHPTHSRHTAELIQLLYGSLVCARWCPFSSSFGRAGLPTYLLRFFIRHVWLPCFRLAPRELHQSVYTNPTFVDVEGRLRIIPFHDSNVPPHSCHLCPSNMCKGLVIDQIRGSLPEKKRRFIYLGDGSGDYCPTLKLERGDFVMPRKNYPLWNWICNNPELVNAEVHGWSSGEELESILLSLIKKVTVVEDTTSDSFNKLI